MRETAERVSGVREVKKNSTGTEHNDSSMLNRVFRAVRVRVKQQKENHQMDKNKQSNGKKKEKKQHRSRCDTMYECVQIVTRNPIDTDTHTQNGEKTDGIYNDNIKNKWNNKNKVK